MLGAAIRFRESDTHVSSVLHLLASSSLPSLNSDLGSLPLTEPKPVRDRATSGQLALKSQRRIDPTSLI